MARAGRRSDAPPSAILNDVSDVAMGACDQDAGHTEDAKKKVEGDLATSLTQVSSGPTSEKKCGLSRYSFKGLKLSFSLTNVAYAFSNIAGSLCGDPSKTPWKVTYASTGEGNRTASANFSAANPSTLQTRRFDGGSSIALKLQYSTDDAPLMKVSGTSTGKIAKVVANPAQASVTSVAVQSCNLAS